MKAVGAAFVGEAAEVTWPAELVERYQRDYAALTRVAYVLLGSRHEAEEVVQDAFIALRPRWGEITNSGGYLRRSVVNGACGVLRHVDDLADDDIAAALGCRRATVRSLVARGLASIRSEVQP